MDNKYISIICDLSFYYGYTQYDVDDELNTQFKGAIIKIINDFANSLTLINH